MSMREPAIGTAWRRAVKPAEFDPAHWRRILTTSAAVLVANCILAAGSAGAQGATQPLLAATPNCSALVGMSIPATAIGLPTRGATVTSATIERAPGDPADVCVVLGAIDPVDPAAPKIIFRVNLPGNWNGKAVHQGGGGYDGVLITGRSPYFLPADREPVRLGYASFGSDSGHQGGSPGNPMGASGDASFALNEEAFVNFGGDQLKKTHDAALAIIARHYGKPPRRTYFYGNSQGGHEGFIVAQRFPEDYDGVVAIHPAYNFSALQLSGLYIAKALYASPASWLSPAKTRLIARAVVASCDALDGLKDGLVSNVAACRGAFDVAELRCADGADAGERCLSDPQIAAARTIAAETDFGAEVSGSRRFGGWPIFEGGLGEGSFFDLGKRAVPGKPPVMSQDAFAFLMADQGVRYMFMREPTYDSLGFVVAEHPEQVRRVTQAADASSADLDAFRRRGGKLLLMHGTADMAIPPSNSIHYYQRVKARYGDALGGFLRFYLAPGFGHGDGPYGDLQWASLDVLDSWVERGQAPGPQTVRGGPGARPLCEYPAWPHYDGRGNPRSAASFACVETD